MTPDDPRPRHPGDPSPADRAPGPGPAPAPGPRDRWDAAGARGPAESRDPAPSPDAPGRADPTVPPGPTDQPASTGSADEVASALLDGLLPPEEAEAARRRPDVATSVARMEAARRALRNVPPPPVGSLDRALAAALDAFDGEAPAPGATAVGHPPPDAVTAGQPAPGPGAPAAPAPPTDLAARRRHRSGRLPRWLGAAAAVALLAIGAAGLAALDRGDGGDAETATMESADDGGQGSAGQDAPGARDEAGAPAPEASADQDSSAGAPFDARVLDAGDLGTFATPEALVDAVSSLPLAEALPAPIDPSTAGQGACPEGPPAPLAGPGVAIALRGQALLAGEPIEVYLVDVAGGRRVVALDSACAVVVDRPLP